MINVPVSDDDVHKTVSTLPRTHENSGIVTVNLKRKLDMKRPYKEPEDIDPNVLREGLDHLRLNHPCYKDVKPLIRPLNEVLSSENVNTVQYSQLIPDHTLQQSIEASKKEPFLSSNENFTRKDNAHTKLRFLDDFLSISDVNSINDEDQILSDEDLSEDEELDDSPFLETTCLVQENPESRVIVNTSEETIHKKTKTSSNIVHEVAPGEGKTPTNYLREEDFDITGFPRHFPDGKYGLYDKERKKAITPQQFFTQRLLNADKRFAKDPDFLFVAQQFVERYALEKQIDVMSRKGNLMPTSSGMKVVQTKDVFSVFKKTKGTPAYWQDYRYDLFARMEHLGPFHLFFTLSCAETKWPEITSSILQAEGYTITFATSPWDGRADSILVNDGIEEVLLPLFQIKNKTKLFQENVLLITQMYDSRVKSFIKNIFKSNKNFPIKHYSYRIEFQMRGMPHVHGVAWIDFTKKEEDEYLMPDKTFNLEKVAQLVDKWTTCSIPSDDEELSKLVKEVNVHTHTDSCRKKGTECRFEFPKLPSPETFVAQPPSSEMSDAEVKRYQRIKEKVREKLTHDLDENYDLDMLLKEVGIEKEDYLEALKISERGIQVVLKRRPCEAFVNNYNIDYLSAWQANIDVQICLDTYAVVSYISDYLTKTDAGLTRKLIQALKESNYLPSE